MNSDSMGTKMSMWEKCMCISKNKEMETIDEMRKREREKEEGGGHQSLIRPNKQKTIVTYLTLRSKIQQKSVCLICQYMEVL